MQYNYCFFLFCAGILWAPPLLVLLEGFYLNEIEVSFKLFRLSLLFNDIQRQPANGSCLYFGINWDYSFLHGFSQNQEGLQALSAFPCTAGIFVTTLKRLSTA